MLPTDTMLTNQKCVAVGRLLPLALLVVLAACTPPGPRALLDGERLLNEGKFNEAIAPLTEATVLLPRNAQTWNHLGLANHNAGRPNEALRAYHKALDVDVNLAPARFNLGCLLIDMKQPAPAATQFAAFTALQPKVGDGWLKRGRAEMLARQFDAAEKSFKSALALNPKQPEVWNTLGIGQLHRTPARLADSFNAFNSAVQQQANYAPALFNAALLSHFYLPRKPVDQRPFALDKYKAFLAMNPAVENLDAIQRIVASLETELSPKPPAPKLVPVPATNPPPALVVAPKPSAAATLAEAAAGNRRRAEEAGTGSRQARPSRIRREGGTSGHCPGEASALARAATARAGAGSATHRRPRRIRLDRPALYLPHAGRAHAGHTRRRADAFRTGPRHAAQRQAQ